MKCRSCGYVSFENRDHCPRCREASGAAPARERPAAPAKPRSRRRTRRKAAEPGEAPAQLDLVPSPPVPAAPAAGPVAPDGGRQDLAALAEFVIDESHPEVAAEEQTLLVTTGADPVFILDDDLIPPALTPVPAGAAAPGARADRLRLPYENPGGDSGDVEPIIDRDEEVPEQYWAAEGAGLPRRALAAAVDALICGGVLAVFALAAWGVLRVAGLEARTLVGAGALGGAALPFALLALAVNLAYTVSFHVAAGATPGKRLAGLEVRTLDGGKLSVGRSLARWCAAVLAAAPAGAGIAWAFFEPRRRGLADLLSGTVIAARRPPAGPADRR